MTEHDIIRSLKTLYHQAAGACESGDPAVTPLPQAGGDRRYFRLSGSRGHFIGTYTPDSNEGKCFVALSRDFHNAGCPVPRIFAVSPDCRCYLQEDLGDVSLFSMLGSDEAETLVRKTLYRLVQLQQVNAPIWSGDCMSAPFCKRQVIWDLNYFKYEFLKPSGVIFDEDLLEDDFERLAERLTAIKDCYCGFMMRDCQSRNVMIAGGEPVFIDFQGGRRGPSLYDAVSLLWQARAGFSPEFRALMLDYYADAYCKGDGDLKQGMLASLPDMALFRTLQVLGAYGFRGLVQHRAHFVASIPGAISNLTQLEQAGALDRYPELKKTSRMLAEVPEFAQAPRKGGLRIEVFSFSYKKGYPADSSGNGGGFMFDCRAMHNPGRYPEYRNLTGRDKPVIEFLEKRGEVFPFLSAAWSLTDAAVERYLARGFTNLQIGFGCTGGQHRSVYCAEATARHLHELFGEADILLSHREHPAEDTQTSDFNDKTI